MILDMLKSFGKMNHYTITPTDSAPLNEVKELFNEYIENLNLPSSWSHDQFIELEVKKSILRSLIRYSEASVKFGLSLAKNDGTFLSPPYPMIHLAGDASETGGYHIDQIGSGPFQSIWTPITDYNYDGLSYRKYGYINYILKKFIRLNPWFNDVSIPIAPNSIYSWNGFFFHRGNINTSANISAALVIKRTNTPLILEPVLSEASLDECRKYSSIEISNLVSILFRIYQFSITKRDKLIDGDLCAEVYDFLVSILSNDRETHLIEHNQIASFSLCLLAQRIEGYSKKETVPTCNCQVLHLASLFLGCENLLSLRRLSQNKNFQAVKADIFSRVEAAGAFGTYQWHATLGEPVRVDDAQIWG